MASPVNVKFAPTKYTVSEGDGFANLTLMSDSPVDMSYTVKVITQDGNATSKYIYACMFVCLYCKLVASCLGLLHRYKALTNYRGEL